MPQKVGFLYLTGLHHLFHTIGIAQKLAERKNGPEVAVVSCSSAHDTVITALRERWPSTGLVQYVLPYPFRFRYLNFKGKTYPSAYDSIRRNRRLFNSFDCIVTTSHDTKRVCAKYGITRPRFVYVSHGCGDRAYGFDPQIGTMDHVLLPGPYYRDRFVDEGILREGQYTVAGYGKLDIPPVASELGSGGLFPEKLPTVLYSPHWDPALSSFRKWGRDVFNFLAGLENYNVIFAPHVLVKHWKYRNRYDLRPFNSGSKRVLVDWGSTASMDTTYLRAADIYIGDVSSMVTEWCAIRPRPCLFLNTHGVRWQEHPDYAFWEYGPVVEQLNALPVKFDECVRFDDVFRKRQQERVDEIMFRPKEGSAVIGAAAVLKVLEG